jgi:hypothetical protein
MDMAALTSCSHPALMIQFEEQSAVWFSQNCKVPQMGLYCIRCRQDPATKNEVKLGEDI